eukprot:TRINITY_DN7312_c0_g1_i1.p2 TRINITY_DN7312_c0_g1~~TRINITY_DN7312_c0_g1_i1.p2  ORF type:complete len:340 (+),score=109.99 TRINITY_DN7312_c0_g1_i1:116-1135(+)
MSMKRLCVAAALGCAAATRLQDDKEDAFPGDQPVGYAPQQGQNQTSVLVQGSAGAAPDPQTFVNPTMRKEMWKQSLGVVKQQAGAIKADYTKIFELVGKVDEIAEGTNNGQSTRDNFHAADAGTDANTLHQEIVSYQKDGRVSPESTQLGQFSRQYADPGSGSEAGAAADAITGAKDPEDALLFLEELSTTIKDLKSKIAPYQETLKKFQVQDSQLNGFQMKCCCSPPTTTDRAKGVVSGFFSGLKSNVNAKIQGGINAEAGNIKKNADEAWNGKGYCGGNTFQVEALGNKCCSVQGWDNSCFGITTILSGMEETVKRSDIAKCRNEGQKYPEKMAFQK